MSHLRDIISIGEIMGKKIYVGNLGYTVTNETLSAKFAEFGTVDSAKVITDRDTNRSKGFAFVEMSTNEEAAKAISALNETDFGGRQMNVSEAKPQEPRTGGGAGGSRGGSSFGGGNGGGSRSRY